MGYNNKIDHTIRSVDSETNKIMVKLFSGDCYIAKEPNEILVTILGSCISACIRDPLLGIGGMNHFLLPDTLNADIHINHEAATRYGAYAMEKLVNGLISKGADKNRLEIKLFGGANVTENKTLIGHKNVIFIREYIKKESLSIAGSDLGGTAPRKLHYFPTTGKVMMKALPIKTDIKAIGEEERNYARSLILNPVEGDAELF